MRKVMLFIMITAFCAAGSVQAEVLYEDNFEGDGLAANSGTGGGMLLNAMWGTPSWADTDGTGATFVGAGANFRQRVMMYSENVFESSGGFRLTVYYTTSSLGSGGHSFAFGLVSDETDLATHSDGSGNSSNPIGHSTVVYSLGVNLTEWNKYTRGLSFTNTVVDTALDESGTNVEFVTGASTPVVIEVDGDGNWIYWIDGIEEAAGTIDGGFDLSKSYHVIVYGQDDNGTKSVQSIMLETLGPGLSAHTPTPASGDTILSNDVPATTSVSWLSPLVDSDGNAIPDSNIVSIDNYKVWWGIDEEPNFVTDTPDDNGTSQSYTPAVPITYDTTYYWRVDTTITLDSNEITGDFTSMIDGSVWNFDTQPSYVPVAVESFDSAITTVDLGTAPLAVGLNIHSEPIYSVDFEILTDDAGYPAGSDAVVSDDGPTALTTTLSTSVAGTYKVKVTVTDYDDANTGPGTTVEAITQVEVYADACQAAKDAPSVWTANYYDRDGDCIVNLGDYSVFAAEWLDDTTMAVQEEYTGVAAYVPQAVYDTRIEAEWYDPNDPNAFSGCIIQENEGASGGKNIGNNGQGSWVDYMIDVPPSAVGVPVDVYIGYGLISGTRTVSFGTEADPAAYGTADAQSTGNWYNFVGHLGGQVTFTASGSQEIRVTCPSGGLNLDWFSFDW